MKKILYSLFAMALFLVSCAKQDTVYKEFVVSGGYIYPAKPINVEAVSGYQRIFVNWERPMDPSLRSSKVFWNNRRDSLSFNYSDYPDGNLSAVISDLEDRSYTFEVINYDADGHSSLAVEVTAAPFGDSWLVSHAERSVLSAKYIDGKTYIKMSAPTDEIVYTKFRYVNTKGEKVESKNLTASENVLVIDDAVRGKFFEYQSAYCPAAGIDTVWTSNWLPSPKAITYNIDITKATASVTDNQIRDSFVPGLILDGIKDDSNSRYFSTNVSTYRDVFPKIIVVDTKEIGDNSMTFDSFVFYQDPAPDAQTRRYLRSVYVYVGDTKFNANDMNYSRNFGEPVLKATLNQNEAEQEFSVSESKSGRYIAIVFRTSYNSSGFVDLWEFEAFGYAANKAE